MRGGLLGGEIKMNHSGQSEKCWINKIARRWHGFKCANSLNMNSVGKKKIEIAGIVGYCHVIVLAKQIVLFYKSFFLSFEMHFLPQ